MWSEHHLACTRHGLFSVTSNIDGHWDRTEGVGPEKVYECHGAPWYMQMPRQLFFFFSGNLLELDMFFLMFVVVVCFLGQNTSQPQHACWHSWPSLAAQIISHVMCEALTRMQCVEDDKSIWPTDPKDIADIQVPVWDLEAGEKARHSTGRMWQVLGSSWSLFV